jgi:hypothetical protein
MFDCDSPGNEARARVAGEDCTFHAERVEERNDVGREVVDAVSPIRLVGIAVPTLRNRDRAHLARHASEDEFV